MRSQRQKYIAWNIAYYVNYIIFEHNKTYFNILTRLLNVVHKRKVKYFIIANEPGKDYGLYNYTNGTGISASDLQSISDYVKEYSIAMKMVDPDIKIIAPELEWEIPGLMDELFPHGTSAYNNAYSLKGTVPSLNSSGKSTGAAYNKQLVDYSSIHNYYGNDPANVCNNRSNLIKEGWILRNKYQNIYNTYLSGTPIKLIVDEFNLGTNVGDSYATSDFIIDTSPNANSFIGGQLAIEGMLGMMRSQNSTGDPVVDISNMWSATEGSSYSFINDASGAGTGPFYRKPSYWHYYLLANYFNGVYYDDSNAPSTVPLSSYANYGLKAFACQSSEYIAVLVINENTTSKAFSISLNNSTSETFAFNMSKSSATVHSDNIDGESSYLLFFNCTGNYLNKQIQLKRTDMTTDYPNYDMLAASHIVGTGTLSNNLMVTLSPNPYDGMLVPDPLYAPKCFGDHTTSASINLSGTPTWVSLPENISVSNTTLVPGLYKVSVAATSGCAIAEKAFSIYEKSPVIDAGLDQIVCLTGSTAFTVGDNELLTSGYNYSWSPSVTSPNTNSSQGTATVSSPTTYQMSTTDGSGCAITDNVVLGNSNPSEVFIKDWPDDVGYVHYRVLGATLAGIAFVIPSFIMVVLLGWAYVHFGGLPWMQAVFYGVGAAVIGIISISSYKLTTKNLGTDYLLWGIFIILAASTFYFETENLWLILASGVVIWFIKAPPKFRSNVKASAFLPFLLQVPAQVTASSKLIKIAWFFTKAGAFVFGSGLAIVPFLYGGVVKEYQWLNEQQFLDAVAVAMITPGPVVITVGFIGYLVGGLPGAIVAALATFIPCYLFTIIPAPYFKRYGKHPAIKAFVDGVTAAAIGAIAGAVIILAKRQFVDLTTVLIAIVSAFILFYFKKIQEPYIIAIAAVIGITIKLVTKA